MRGNGPFQLRPNRRPARWWADLQFTHHAYEAALAEAFTGVAPIARSWIHVGTVMVEGQKMAKSTDNLVFIHDLLQRLPAVANRFLILSRSWRVDWEFEETSLEEATRQLDHLWKSAATPVELDSAHGDMIKALFDNLDVPASLAIAWEAGCRVLSEVVDFLSLRDTTTWSWSEGYRPGWRRHFCILAKWASTASTSFPGWWVKAAGQAVSDGGGPK
jgi:hypothetical protein